MWNPFKHQNASYLQLAGHKEFHEDDSDNGEGEGLASAATLVHQDEHEYFTKHGLNRPRRSILSSGWCTLLIAFISLLIGLISGQFLRLEHNIDGYLRTSPPSLIIYTPH